MTDTDEKCGKRPMRKRAAKAEDENVDDAFDVWLKRGLHQLYDDVAAEPVPDELLRLIEDDRAKKD